MKEPLEVVRPLNLDIFDKLEKLHKEISPLGGELEDRFDYILRAIGRVFNSDFTYWYVEGAKEGFYGDIESLIGNDEVILGSVIFGECQDGDCCTSNWMILLDGKERNVARFFPKRWLFENFEQELITGAEEYKAYILKKVNKMSKETKKSLISSAKEKLTYEEIKALGI